MNLSEVYIGSFFGLILTVLLVAFVPPIQHFMIWSWTNPYLWAASGLLWLVIGIYAFLDKS